MSTNRKASITKRARELAQKDGVRDREQRRAERKLRRQERAASGIVGPEIDSTPANTDDDVDSTSHAGGAMDGLPRSGT